MSLETIDLEGGDDIQRMSNMSILGKHMSSGSNNFANGTTETKSTAPLCVQQRAPVQAGPAVQFTWSAMPAKFLNKVSLLEQRFLFSFMLAEVFVANHG